MSAAEESAEWHQWEQAKVAARFAASEVRENNQAEAEEQERTARLEAKRDPAFELFRDEMTGRPSRTHGAIMYDAMTARDPWVRDPQAELGSEANPVLLFAWPPETERSQRVSEPDRLAGRVRHVDADGYMARAVAEFDRRRQVQRQREFAAEIAYHEAEIARAGGY